MVPRGNTALPLRSDHGLDTNRGRNYRSTQVCSGALAAGRVDHEHALGSGRTDILVTLPESQSEWRFVNECNPLRGC